MAELATDTIKPAAVAPAGEHVYGPAAVPDKAKSFTARLARVDFKDLDDSRRVILAVEWSLDNGRTWESGGSITTGLWDDGKDRPYSSFRTRVPEGKKRFVRVRLDVPSGGCKCAVDIVWDDYLRTVSAPLHRSLALESTYEYEAVNTYSFTTGTYADASSDAHLIGFCHDGGDIDSSKLSRSPDTITDLYEPYGESSAKVHLYWDEDPTTTPTALVVSDYYAYNDVQVYVLMLSGAANTQAGDTDGAFVYSGAALDTTVASESGEIVYAFWFTSDTKTVTCSGATEVLQDDMSSSHSAGIFKKDGAASVDMDLSWSGNCSGCVATIAIEPAAAGGLSIPVAMHHYTKNVGAR